MFYTLTDTLKVGGRAEWWKADGTSFNEVTGGVNIQALSNLVFRPEYRYNWAPSDNVPFVTTAAGPAASYIDQGIAAVDMVLSF